MIKKIFKMDNEQFMKTLYTTFGKTILVVFMMNFVNLLVEIYIINKDSELNITFLKGYFTLNGKEIGFNMFSNIIGFVLLFGIYLYYKKNIKSMPEK